MAALTSYLFVCAQVLDSHGITFVVVIMLLNPPDTQQSSRDGLILLFDITSDHIAAHQRSVLRQFFVPEREKHNIPLNYCFS